MTRGRAAALLLALALGPISSGRAGDAPPSQITFQTTAGEESLLWRVEATAGATPENLTPALDAISSLPGRHRGPITVSPDGAFYVFLSERFDADSQGWEGLTIAPSDLGSAETVKDAAGQTIHNEGLAQSTSNGQAIVYVAGDGSHVRDLWVIERMGEDWGMPRVISGDSPYPYNYLPALSPDETRVLFNAGDESFPGTHLCEVGLDGDGFRVVVSNTDVPPGYSASAAVHSGAYLPNGDVVFEAEWSNMEGGGERVWRRPAAGGAAMLLTPVSDSDNSPVTLPDGRIASIFLSAPGPSDGLHEIKVMDGDGQGAFMLTQPGPLFSEVDDIGLGAGPLLAPEPGAAPLGLLALGLLGVRTRRRTRAAQRLARTRV